MAKVESLGFTSLYNEELATISQELLMKPQNRLRLMNIIGMRHMVVLSHLGHMENMKKMTRNLLEELNEIIQD